MVLVLMDQSKASMETLTLARKFGRPQHSVRMDAIIPFAPDAVAAILALVADDLDASAIFAAGTERGNDVMARLAARTGQPFAANCIDAEPGSPVSVTRLRWGGSLLESALLHSPRPLITVAPNTLSVEAEPAPIEVDAKPFIAHLEETDLAVRVSDHVDTTGGGVSLAEAKVVVSGGRGVGSKEGFAIIEELAGLLGGAVGCSRVVTSAGWRPHSDQIGQTGVRIAPDLYIACGISGATQHIVGCKGAKHILVINTDADAPILSRADYAVIGDVRQVVPALVGEIREATKP